MVADADLAAAVANRVHWRLEDDVAVYAPPGVLAEARVWRLAGGDRRARYHLAIIRNGVAVRALSCGTSTEAVRLAERARLT
jgi:hypothetical protein